MNKGMNGAASAPEREISAKVEALLGRLSTEEEIGQLCQIGGTSFNDCPPPEEVIRRNKAEREEVPAAWKPIIEIELFEQVQANMAENNERAHRGAQATKLPALRGSSLRQVPGGRSRPHRSASGRKARARPS